MEEVRSLDLGFTKLGSGFTKITDASLKEVAKLKQLRFVNLEDTKVTKAGVDQLIKALPKSRITHNAMR